VPRIFERILVIKFVPSPDGRSDREKRLYPYTVEEHNGYYTLCRNGSIVMGLQRIVENDAEEDDAAKEKALLHANYLSIQHAASNARFLVETKELQFRMRERHKRLQNRNQTNQET
jgi:hypothetical protein